MVTTIGTESKLEDLLTDLIQLDYDAADAYQAAIDRLENAGYRTEMSRFKADHLRHIDELGETLRAMGRTPPKEGDVKGYLTKGKVIIGGLMGDEAILQAMRTNEDDTNTAYERAVGFRDTPATTREMLERAREDEQRHREWIVAAIDKH
ncbi:MAG: ferritin-like domain-containing protein [Alphaproteobacteria bacterium]|nr:ferritin-like domain-containing protein [Alphaproteobacteria bacterium]